MASPPPEDGVPLPRQPVKPPLTPLKTRQDQVALSRAVKPAEPDQSRRSGSRVKPDHRYGIDIDMMGAGWVKL